MAATHSPYSQRLSIVDDPRSQVTFLITDCPNPDTLVDEFLPLLQSHNCKHVARLCDPTAYSADPLREHGITVWDWAFEDGSVPPEPIVKSYRNLLDSLLSTAAETDEPKRRDSGLSSNTSSTSKPVVALHCVSGIGRAPVLVAAALIDAGIDPLEAVELVRAKRRGALNKKQLAWLMDKKSGFKRRKRGKDGKGTISKMFGGMFGKK